MSRNGKFQGGSNAQHGAKTAGVPGNNAIDEFDLASDIKGNNRLMGNNQNSMHNERQSMAMERGETDGLIESFEKLDKDVRAERDLGKRH
jgi:hypothetical protein